MNGRVNSQPGTTTLMLDWDARWVVWGKGRYHIEVKGSRETACGRELPDELRTSPYSGFECSRCKAHTELAEKADDFRHRLWEAVQNQRNEKLEQNRAGTFIVYRCKLCGVQHHPNNGSGVPFCLLEGHQAELEVVVATGPHWESLSNGSASAPSDGKQAS